MNEKTTTDIRTSHSLSEVIRGRRSLRRYSDKAVPKRIIVDVLEAAIWAPSAHNRQPWRFVVVQDNAVKHQLARAMGQHLQADLQADNVPAEVIARDVSRSYERITQAPVLILVCLTMMDMDTYRDERRNHNEYLMAVQSTAMAGQNLLLAAHDHGLGACWMCAPLFCPDAVRTSLDLPADWIPQGLVTLGYPAQERDKKREPLETRMLWR